MVSQITVGGGGGCLTVGVSCGKSERVFCHCDKLIWAKLDAIRGIIDKEQQAVAVGDVDNCSLDW
uniref:Uncharacterized protein n=1 Tax=Romanomermis culicivorax TaxID=13658 RepID=A0A915I8X1_ROMCU